MVSYYIIAYLAFCVPAFAAAFAVKRLALTTTIDIYVLVLVGLTGLTLPTLMRRSAKPHIT